MLVVDTLVTECNDWRSDEKGSLAEEKAGSGASMLECIGCADDGWIGCMEGWGVGN